MKRLLFCFILLIICPQIVFSRQDKINPNIKNESGLNYLTTDSPARGDDVIGATFCSGSIKSKTEELLAVGVSTEDLKKEVYCTVGDFDGNGYLDFAIWGGNKQKIEWPDYKNYLVLFFKNNEIIRTTQIKSEFPGRLLVNYPSRTQIGPNGEPISKFDALWLIGETDGYDDTSKGIVYIYNLYSKKFDKVQFGG